MLSSYHRVSLLCGRIVTETYSTSFAASVRLLHRDIREAIYSIYGFVRLADEIVDTFHDQDKTSLLTTFRNDTYLAISNRLSLNPVLHGFQLTVRKYGLEMSLIEAFLRSMEMDLEKKDHDADSYCAYIYGSAEVVGLMCLRVFCEGNDTLFQHLVPFAQSLGAAFQKVNFLRDLGADDRILDRRYFPNMTTGTLTPELKKNIEADIENDFLHAAAGIPQLPEKARLGVYVAYRYYYTLFKKIRSTPARQIAERRVRIRNYRKWIILVGAGLKQQLKLI